MARKQKRSVWGIMLFILLIISILCYVITGPYVVFRKSDTTRVFLMIFIPLCPILWLAFLLKMEEPKVFWGRVVASLVFALVLSCIAGMIYTGPLYLLNMVWDKSQPVDHPVVVYRKFQYPHTRRGPEYGFYFDDWKPPHPSTILGVTKEFCGAHQDGDIIDIRTKPGWLGAEWIVSPLAVHGN